MKLSVHRFREKARSAELSMYGFVDEEMLEMRVRRYAEARQRYKQGKMDFDPFKDDPNCNSCRKRKREK